jgi:hypothetical protein
MKDMPGEACGRVARYQRVERRRSGSLGSRMIRWRLRDMAGDRWKSSSLSLSIMVSVSSSSIRAPSDYQKAKRARDARIAHYKDLEENYKLVVEEVYF